MNKLNTTISLSLTHSLTQALNACPSREAQTELKTPESTSLLKHGGQEATKTQSILNLERSLGLVEILTQILLICSHVYQDAPHTGDEVKAALIIVDKNVPQDRNGRCHLTFAAKH